VYMYNKEFIYLQNSTTFLILFKRLDFDFVFKSPSTKFTERMRDIQLYKMDDSI
jgi:hypothetical protein